jgi:CRISPR-associated exonuclease Cas4
MRAIPISALQHYLFCPRQCALIHLEQVWAKNQFTTEGKNMHERAHDGADESRAAMRITRGMSIESELLKITGQCDIVEFHHDGTIVPIEYKRGKPKTHRADEVQLCAQALCLEEMQHAQIARGFLYYGEKRRRTEVIMDQPLRDLTLQTISACRAMFAEQITPAAIFGKHCHSCSLYEICMPEATRGSRRSAAEWFQRMLSNES